MTTALTVALIAVCAAAGVWVYLHAGPDGGRARSMSTEEVRRLRRLRSADRRYRRLQDDRGLSVGPAVDEQEMEARELALLEESYQERLRHEGGTPGA